MCSSVDSTQSSDAGVGDESAVVSQVARDVAGQTQMNKCDNRRRIVVGVSSSFQIINRFFTYAPPYLWNQLPSSFR